MCGIVGFRTDNEISKLKIENCLEKMTTFIEHRGPDDFGYYYHTENAKRTMSMGFRRLSIIDLTMDGHQPMQYKDLTITFNGEVYNFQEIKNELIKIGYQFNSKTDTEVILKGFHYWGNKVFNKLNGMFAIAIYNNKLEELTLVRDRLGIKPLSYYSGKSGFFYSSEIKAIVQNELTEVTLNKNVISQYLYHGYINQPNSIYNEIKKVKPGYIISLNKNGEHKEHKFWDLPTQKNEYNQLEETTDKLDNLVNSAIELRMISDVPLGSFLSGGYDSSLVSAIMQSQVSSKIDTFSIGFTNPKYDESLYASQVAKHINSNHHTFQVEISQTKEVINMVYKMLDEPFADSSLIPTYLLSKLTKSKVTVALSGDGGDELFHGYKSYASSQNLIKYKTLSKLIHPLQKVQNINKILYNIDPRYSKYPLLNSNRNIINHGYINSKIYLNGLIKDTKFIYNPTFFNIQEDNNIIDEHSRLDIKTYLPNDILMKVDKASMLNSLEARTPLLDHRIVEFSQLVNPQLKMQNGNGKYVLKHLTHKYIPQSIMERPKKGFSIPVLSWLKTDLNFLISDYLNTEFIESQNIFHNDKINYLLNMFRTKNDQRISNTIWNLVVFQMWWNENKKYLS